MTDEIIRALYMSYPHKKKQEAQNMYTAILLYFLQLNDYLKSSFNRIMLIYSQLLKRDMPILQYYLV